MRDATAEPVRSMLLGAVSSNAPESGPPPRKAAASDNEPQLWPRLEFCAAHGIGPTTFHEEVNAGRLIAVKLQGRTMVSRQDAKAWRDALPRVNPKV